MATWNTSWDFLVDLFKKLIVAIVAGFITALATFVYANTILAAVSSFSADWWSEYWFLVIICFLVVVLEGYALYKYPSLFPWLVIATIVIAAFFSLYRLHMLSENWPITPFFCLFVVILFNLVAIVSFVVCQAVANIRSL